MAGKVIGTSLNFGYPGNVSRVSDTVIMSFPVGGADGTKIKYGAPVAYDPTTNKIVPVDSNTTAGQIIGFAVRHIGQPYEDSSDGWYYKPGDVADVLVRGSMVVEIGTSTGIAARGQVYVTKAGVVTSVAGSGDTAALAVSHAIFATGKVDANNTVEITLTERNI